MNGPVPSKAPKNKSTVPSPVHVQQGTYGRVRTRRSGAISGLQRTAGNQAISQLLYGGLRGSGRPLDPDTRATMEACFNADFSRVRVHTDSRSARLARAARAQAYTSGQDVVFGSGLYAPWTSTGRHLLAHELAHIVQMGENGQQSPKGLALSNSRWEGEADSAARDVSCGRAPQVSSGAPSFVYRQTVPQLSDSLNALQILAQEVAVGPFTNKGIVALIFQTLEGLDLSDPYIRRPVLEIIAGSFPADVFLNFLAQVEAVDELRQGLVSEHENLYEQRLKKVGRNPVSGGYGPGVFIPGFTSTLRQPPGYNEIKEAAYQGLINTARSTRESYINFLRENTFSLPAPIQPLAINLIDFIDADLRLLFDFLFFELGVVVGFGEGLAKMVIGLLQIAYALLDWCLDWVLSILGYPEPFQQDWEAISLAFHNLLNLEPLALLEAWKIKFQEAPRETRALMVGDFVGEVLAAIATWQTTSAKIGRMKIPPPLAVEPQLAAVAAGGGGTMAIPMTAAQATTSFGPNLGRLGGTGVVAAGYMSQASKVPDDASQSSGTSKTGGEPSATGTSSRAPGTTTSSGAPGLPMVGINDGRGLWQILVDEGAITKSDIQEYTRGYQVYFHGTSRNEARVFAHEQLDNLDPNRRMDFANSLEDAYWWGRYHINKKGISEDPDVVVVIIRQVDEAELVRRSAALRSSGKRVILEDNTISPAELMTPELSAAFPYGTREIRYWDPSPLKQMLQDIYVLRPINNQWTLVDD